MNFRSIKYRVWGLLQFLYLPTCGIESRTIRIETENLLGMMGSLSNEGILVANKSEETLKNVTKEFMKLKEATAICKMKSSLK